MGNVIIIDHRQDQHDTRYVRLHKCLESVCTRCRYERHVYGGKGLEIEPATFTAGLLEQTSQTLAGTDLVLLHCGDGQHLVPDVLSGESLLNLPCLLFTGGDPDSKAQKLSEVADPSRHVVLPIELPPRLPEDWPQSRDGIALRECVKAILSGAPPKDAVRTAFGDPKLDGILDGLYQTLDAGVEKLDIKELRRKRDALLESYYERTRGWRNPGAEQGEA